jgi:alpha-D-xyloside xylohydrolase
MINHKHFYYLFVFVLNAFTSNAQYRKTADGVVVYPDQRYSGQVEAVRLQVLSSKIIRVTASADSVFPSVKSLIVLDQGSRKPGFTVAKQGETVVVKTGSLSAVVQLSTGAVSFLDASGRSIVKERPYNGRTIEEAVFEGQPSYALRQTFETGADDAYYGLGQHQDGHINYKGQQVFLFQNNTEVAVPFLTSSRNYGILWDNYSLTKFGDVRPWLPLSSLQLYSGNGDKGFLTASYSNNRNQPDSVMLSLSESDINYPFIDDTKQKLPKDFNVQNGVITWNGSFSTPYDGLHKFHVSYAGYFKMWVNGTLVLERWRQAWNPGNTVVDLPLISGAKNAVKMQWIPDGGESYLRVKWLPPVPKKDMNAFTFSSEAGKQLDYYFVSGNNMDEVISGYRTLTGKAPIVPKWALGFWQSRERYKTQEELLGVVAEFRKRKIPLDNIVLDWFYWKEDQWGSQQFDATRFPSPDSMISTLHNRYNTRFMISVWPKFYEGANTYQDFNSRGWLYKRNIGDRTKDWVGKGYTSTFYDVFNDEAKKAFWELIRKNIYTKGIDAWWMDASEPDILSNVSPERRKDQMAGSALTPAAEWLNAYGLENAKVIYNGQRSVDPDKRVFLLTRSGFAGSQHYGATIWSGDIASRWTDMKDQIAAGVNFSMSGLPYWTMDIGGFSVERRYENPNAADQDEWRELNTRWFQFGAFAPLFRVHGQYPFREVYNIAPEGHPAYNSMLYYNKLRYRLMPYIYSLAGSSFHHDYSIMRGLVMDFKDTAVRSIPDQYLFGPSILVSPVTEYKQRQRKLYLPAGQGWYEMHGGKYHHGGQWITTGAPYEHIPLFAKEGSIVPFGPDLQYTSERPADTIRLFVYRGKDASFQLYEDEGTNYQYEKGKFSFIRFDYRESTGTLTIQNREGSFPGMLDQRVFIIVPVSKQRGAGMDSSSGKAVLYNGKKMVIQINQ